MKCLFFWLSGAATDYLLDCPAWEQRKFVAIGSLVLVPSVFAFIVALFVISTITSDKVLIISLAFFWSFAILSIDRCLLASYRPYATRMNRFFQFCLRLVISVLLGMTISHPIILMIFHDAINTRIALDKNSDIENIIMNAKNSKDSINRDFDDTRERMINITTILSGNIPDSSGNQSHLPHEDSDEFREDHLISMYRTEKSALELEKKEYEKSAEHYRQLSEDELNGRRTAREGPGPRYQDLHRLFEMHLARVQEAANRISELDNKIAHRIRELNLALEKENNEKKYLFNATKDKRIELVNKTIDAAEQYQNTIKDISIYESKQINDVANASRKDILSLSLALHKIMNDATHRWFARFVYALILVFFVAIDSSAIILKFITKPGPYDSMVYRDEYRYDTDRESYKAKYKEYSSDIIDTKLKYFANKEKNIHQDNGPGKGGGKKEPPKNPSQLGKYRVSIVAIFVVMVCILLFIAVRWLTENTMLAIQFGSFSLGATMTSLAVANYTKRE